MSYHALIQGRKDAELKEIASGTYTDPAPFASLIHGTLRGWVRSSGFPCNGAKAAFSSNSYRLAIYDSLSDQDTTLLAADLLTYVQEYANTPVNPPKAQHQQPIPLNRTFASFLACFKEEPVCDETAFENHLWAVLESLRAGDGSQPPLGYSSDASQNDFAFCFAGEAFFVAAFHPGSWRWSRRFMFPLLVFNMHKQFDGLKASGSFTSLRDKIRQNDVDLQGSPNTVAADHGTRSEAPQYAMRKVPARWSPPGWNG